MKTQEIRMNFRRLTVLACAGAAALGMALPAAAQAQPWPTKPIRFVVPFSAGGANDLMARAAAEGASKVLGQPIVIENKPGAGAMLGTDVVAKSAPDGYTFLVSAAGVVSNSMIRKSVPYKDSDLVPVAMIGLAPSVIVAPADAPYKDLKEFVAASKKGQGLHFATAGTGSTPHFVEGLLEKDHGAKLDVVPYKSGSESITAVLGNQVDATSEASIVVLPYIRSGKLKALATTWTQRISAYPQLSTAMEQGFDDIRIAHWAGVHAPAGTPPAILDKMADAVDKAMKDPATVKRLKEMGIEPVGGDRAAFVKFVDEERARLGAVVKATGMKED
ncbi:tripartite tricarboxylate transporter substrate binding protein [Variovorax sp.]|uniref:tripartite tricarboxylate transporter substrate binding protein n=1 Tax=Variovorax sp. TaxID=1871043 RepID=UPI0039C9861A